MPETLLKKETLAQVFSCEVCEISRKTFSYITPPVVASAFLMGCFDLKFRIMPGVRSALQGNSDFTNKIEATI